MKIITVGQLKQELQKYSDEQLISVLNDHIDEEFDIECTNLSDDNAVQILIIWK